METYSLLQEADTMKTKTLFTSILLISLFLLTACQQNDNKQETTGAFIGGSQGVIAKFEAFGVEEDGIYTIFDSETFPIEVTLTNKGEYDVKSSDVTVELQGPSQSEFNGIAAWSKNNVDLIDKISELVKDGGEETITFGDEAKYLSPVKGVTDRNWFANVEYNYETYIIVPEVCLKQDLSDNRVCTIKEEKLHAVSGAPITVTEVTEDTAGRGIMALKFVVSNVAGGKVAKQAGEFGVTDRLTYSLDDPAWECKSGGKVNEARLLNDGAEIVCRLKEALPDGHISTKQVTLTLQYKYRDIVRETLRIKESAE
jgi:hypothetical protein